MRAAVFGAAVVAAHYEKPPCATDEVEAQIGQAGGVACLPACTSSNTCPSDAPKGVTATPQCALQGQGGNKYCGLICQKDSQCGDATCQILQAPIGVCTYSQKSETATLGSFQYQPFMSEANHIAAFEEFVAKNGKTYSSEQEKAVRYSVFKENRVFIDHANNDRDLTFALNEFADLTHAEFRSIYVGGYRPDLTKTFGANLGTHVYSGADLPTEVDWSTKGAVTDIKNQGQCGSCWSFSTTGALEGAWQIATGNLVSLSEQQFVDCDHVDQGCGGGLMDNAFKFAEANAICSDKSYPYQGVAGTCSADTCETAIPKGSVTGFKDVDSSMEALMEAVSMGPVSIAIEADQQAFQFYKDGVLSQPCGTQLDHGVLLVGYGTQDGKDYWKVKNSWGATWGLDGFILLQRGNSPDGQEGECGLLTQPSFPVVQKAAAMLV